MIEVYLTAKASAQVRGGFPWVYKSDIMPSSSLEISEKGELVIILDNKGKKLAYGYLNYASKISIRILTNDLNETVASERFFHERVSKALEKRQKHFGNNYKYSRVIFGESDFLPGFIVDSYGEYLSCEITTAGAFRLKDDFLKSLKNSLKPKGIVISVNANDKSENLKNEKITIGEVPDVVTVLENGITYFSNLKEGQKTGWFYDQRANRSFLSGFAKDKNFCDLFTHSGGFGILSAAKGAKYVLMVDSSELALDLAKESAEYNNLIDKCEFIKADVFDFLKNYLGQKFDVINTDPPAFIKAKKYIESGMRGYSKLISGCVDIYEKKGVGDKIFALTSCSHYADRKSLKKVVEKNIPSPNFQLIANTGADKDHTPHPHLAKTEYLKFLAYSF